MKIRKTNLALISLTSLIFAFLLTSKSFAACNIGVCYTTGGGTSCETGWIEESSGSICEAGGITGICCVRNCNGLPDATKCGEGYYCYNGSCQGPGSEGQRCGTDTTSVCKAGTLTCPDGYSRDLGGGDCKSGFLCCKGSSVVTPVAPVAPVTPVTPSTDPNGSTSGNQCLSNGGKCFSVSSECPTGTEENTGFSCGEGGKQCCIPTTELGEEFIGGIEIPPVEMPNPPGGIIQVLTHILNWMLTVFLILAVIAFVVTGVLYIVAMGDAHSNAAENAKNNFKYAIIAVAVVAGSLIIIYTIENLLSIRWF